MDGLEPTDVMCGFDQRTIGCYFAEIETDFRVGTGSGMFCAIVRDISAFSPFYFHATRTQNEANLLLLPSKIDQPIRLPGYSHYADLSP